MINCSIITIGDELLIGQTIDTNSAWIGRALNDIGIWVKRRVAVGDIREEIEAVILQEQRHADLLILTGGLGPTADDITKPFLCKFYDTQLVKNERVHQHVVELFAKRGRPLLETNLKQAMVPESCQVLFNAVGTAPGMWFEDERGILISLPGVPFEMQYLMEHEVLPRLKKSGKTTPIHHRTLVTSGEGESFIAHRLSSFEEQLPPDIKLAYLPKLGQVKLRLTASGISEAVIDEQFRKLQSLLDDILVCDADLTLQEVIHDLLLQRGETVSVAESCTGGRISALITSIKGSSRIFRGGLVPYAEDLKVSVLGMGQHILDSYSVYSKETAIAMAEQCLKKFDSTYAIGITGHLEPQQNGTYVWIAVAEKNNTVGIRIQLYYSRDKNASLVETTALNLLRKFILRQSI